MAVGAGIGARQARPSTRHCRSAIATPPACEALEPRLLLSDGLLGGPGLVVPGAGPTGGVVFRGDLDQNGAFDHRDVDILAGHVAAGR